MQEFLARQSGGPTGKPEGIIIDGAFGCQVCHVQVEEAEYFPEDRLLIWQCESGHNSHIEDLMM